MNLHLTFARVGEGVGPYHPLPQRPEVQLGSNTNMIDRTGKTLVFFQDR